MENKGKVKNTNKIFKRASYALLISSGIFLGLIFSAYPYEMDANEAKNDMHDLCSNVDIEDSALEYYKNKYEKQSVAGCYGVVDRDFMDKNIEKEARLNYVLDNIEDCPTETAEELNRLNSIYKDNSTKSKMISGSAFTASVLSAIAACVVNAKVKPEDKEM